MPPPRALPRPSTQSAMPFTTSLAQWTRDRRPKPRSRRSRPSLPPPETTRASREPNPGRDTTMAVAHKPAQLRDSRTAMQCSLFNAQPVAATVDTEPSINARNAKRQLDTLRSQLATAQADLEDVN